MGKGDGGRRDGSINGKNQSRASKGYGVYFGGKTDKGKVEGEKESRNGVKVKEIQESPFKNKMRPNNLSSNLSI